MILVGLFQLRIFHNPDGAFQPYIPSSGPEPLGFPSPRTALRATLGSSICLCATPCSPSPLVAGLCSWVLGFRAPALPWLNSAASARSDWPGGFFSRQEKVVLLLEPSWKQPPGVLLG